ncbi:dual specificity protein kinase TTK-like [Lineus longissimus]|uniref:dual specificity protein kinase TTK-like n=1 Tax=Lineus longissimus TaxID=88925 RepID=UPI002B4CD1AA
MTSLRNLSKKLNQHRPSVTKEGQGDDTANITGGTTGNPVTANTSELELWANKIRNDGNRPGDWLEYIKHMHCVADCMSDKERKYNMLSGLYNKALESIPEEFVKEEPYAKILVQFAKLRSGCDKSSSEVLFKKATTLCRHLSFVHIAAAEFYVAQGDSHKAKRVLEKALHVYHPRPIEHVRKALTDMVGSKMRSNEQHDSISGHTGNTSQVFRDDTGGCSTSFTNPFNQGTDKENLLPPRRDSRTSSSDEADTFPINKTIDLSKPDEKTGPRTLRSYHSTPDCKSAGALSVEKPSLSTRKRVMGRAMRVLANQLPQVAEDDDSSGDEGIKGIKPFTMDSPPATADADTGYPSSASEAGKRNPPSDFKQPRSVTNYGIYAGQRKHSVMDVDEPDHEKENHAQIPFKKETKAFPLETQPSNMDRKFSLMDVDHDTGPIADLPMPQPVKPERQMRTEPMSLSRNLGVPLATPGGPGPQDPQCQLSTPRHQAMIPGAMPYVGTPIMQNPNDVVVVNSKPYTILKVIGTGGSSKVYEVYENSKRLCAIKRVDLNDADEFTVQSYKNEINLLKRLQYSDKVIKMYDYEFIEETNILHVVMERGDTDLANFFKNKSKHGGISPQMVMFYWAEMLKAVQVLHKEGIVHSDLKPANFLLVTGNVKLIDFGIANAIQQDKTSVTRESQIGTLNYMSPEAISQADCGPVYDSEGRLKPKFKLGVKSDVWSLGCILYYMVYQKAPFHHIRHNLAKLQAIINPNVPIPFPEIKDKNLMHVLQHCLRRNPKERLGIDELLLHPFLKQDVRSPPAQEMKSPPDGEAMYRLVNQLVMQLGVDSPNSAQNLSKNLIQQFKSGQALDLGSLNQKQDGHSFPG